MLRRLSLVLYAVAASSSVTGVMFAFGLPMLNQLRRAQMLLVNDLLRSQSLDDRALGVLVVRIAVGNQASEFPAQPAQLSDTGVDKAEFGGRKVACRRARAPLLQFEKTRDFGERKSHGLRALDKAQSMNVPLGISADSAKRTWWFP